MNSTMIIRLVAGVLVVVIIVVLIQRRRTRIK
jgi:preprotein translocase subunit SecG